jgi:hypothetical protein
VSKIIQIRDFLAEKFPGVRLASEPAPARDSPLWPTGLAALDDSLAGGLPRGALTELCAADNAWGSAFVLRQIIRQASESHQWVALIDGMDSFDPGAFDNATLEHLLWMRCANADEAVKCADLILRDGNLPIVILDLAMNSARELRRVPSSTWYRFQRLAEGGAAAFLAITPQPQAASARQRVFLRGGLPAEAFDLAEPQLRQRIAVENAAEQREHIGISARRA